MIIRTPIQNQGDVLARPKVLGAVQASDPQSRTASRHHQRFAFAINFHWQLWLISGEGDMNMMFSESNLVRNIFSKMSEISVIYTVQILPRTDKASVNQRCHLLVILCRSQDSVEVVVFDGDPEKTTAMVMNYFRSRSCSHIPATIWWNFWKYKRGGHLANVSDKDFFQAEHHWAANRRTGGSAKGGFEIFTGNHQWSCGQNHASNIRW